LFSVKILGDFELCHRGVPILLAESTQRFVALLALAAHPVRRNRVAAQLWPDRDDERAQANLRSCLWRLRQVAPGMIGACCDPLGFASCVRVDLAELTEMARRLDAGLLDLGAIDPDLCCADLLPEFYDDFVEGQRELVRQLRLRTLEQLARLLSDAGCFGHALRLALLAVSQAPLRESAHELVLEIHLAEGNTSEALRHYERLKNTLWQELGIRPSDRIRATMATGTRTEDRAAPGGVERSRGPAI
jgi:DNA-binding SARP family transcriptional activator